MKNQDLRIGNYFQDQNLNLLKVVEITEKNQVFEVVDRSNYPLPDGWKAEPILADEFMLLYKFKFGKGYGGHDGENEHYEFVKHGLVFSSSEDDDEIRFFDHNQDKWIRTPYIHQIQNLIYQLTGQELTIEP